VDETIRGLRDKLHERERQLAEEQEKFKSLFNEAEASGRIGSVLQKLEEQTRGVLQKVTEVSSEAQNSRVFSENAASRYVSRKHTLPS
jgi:hypothetical protein